MPNHVACVKRLKQDDKRSFLNNAVKRELKTLAKKIRTSGTIQEKEDMIMDFYSKLDKAAKRNIIHKKNASRKKSRIALYLNKEKTTATAAK